ncbi:MAG: M23 family metallopeptidase [Firmicutes bacterium]|nr:M23 family metallopeptidase [Bacillota bacterium]
MNMLRNVLRIKKNISHNVSGRDRHAVKKAKAPGSAIKNVFSRRFLHLGGICLAVFVLLAVVLPRMGLLPAPEIPGLDKEGSSLPNDGPAGEFALDDNGSSPETGAETKGSPNYLPESPPAAEEEPPLLSGESSGEDGDNGAENFALNTGGEATATGDEVAAAEDYFPASPPALPLPSWYLHTAYGDYTSEILPSGGLMHRRTRGVLLAGTPGASVSAMWDGVVVTAGEKSFPYGNFVVLKHEEGYSTLYGNLREIWVKEGEEISRGEIIGLLPHTPAARDGELSGDGGSVELNSPDRQAATPSTAELPFHTVVGGSFNGRAEEKGVGGKDLQQDKGHFSAASDRQSVERAEGDSEKDSSFHRGNPLLYLELRQGNRYLDPLLFIGQRN